VSTALTQAVSKDSASVVITSDTNPAIVDVDFTLTITVVPNVPGGGNFNHNSPQYVSLSLNGTQIGSPLLLNASGSATITLDVGAPGEAAFTASYQGDTDQFYGSQTLMAFVAAAAPTAAATQAQAYAEADRAQYATLHLFFGIPDDRTNPAVGPCTRTCGNRTRTGSVGCVCPAK
jgi:hypothetical protein